MADAGDKGARAVWKHIGLYAHSVGTFIADPAAIQWKSAMTGTSDLDDVTTARLVPAKHVASAQWSVFGRSGHLRVQSRPYDANHKGPPLPHELRFDGFPPTDYDRMRDALQRLYDVELTRHPMSSAGASFGNTDITNRNLVFRQCILEDADEEGEEFEPRDGDEMMSLMLNEVSQCVLPGNNRNELELQFLESDTVEAGTDQLVAVRLYIPPDPDVDPSDRDAPTPAELLQSRIMKIANVKKTSGDVIAEFDENKGTFVTPRGRYTLELYDSFLRMRGAKYDYKIKYDDISRLFLLPKPDDVHVAFVIALDKPIRQGQQRYGMLVLQTTREHAELTINLDEETLEREYNGDLQPVMHGSLSNLVAKTFKVITKKKVFIPGKFANANQQSCVKCALRANEGHLYPLEKQFIFIHKPPVLIRFDEVESVEFQRYAGGQGSTRNFDLCVTLAQGAGDTGTREYTFSGIDRSDYAGLYNFLSGKKIRIKNLQEDIIDEGPREPAYDERYDAGEDEMESSEDEDYNAEGGESSSEDISGSEDDDDLGDESADSDLEEYRKTTKKKKKKAAEDEGGSDDEPKSKKKRKKGASPKGKSPAKKKQKKKKDPNAPKKGMSSYQAFVSARRSEIKAENPDASFGEISQMVGKEFKNLSKEERKEYDEKAKADKERYEKEMEDYSAPEESDESDSDEDTNAGGKKGKKAKKDPKAPKRPTTSYMYFTSAKRAEIKEKNPDASFGDIARAVAAAFKNLSEEEKQEWNDMADKDKLRYKNEMKDYVPPKGTKAGGKKSPKKKRDPNEPKRPMNSYMLFANKMRASMKEENPDASQGDIAKLLGENFKGLSDEERAKWDSKAKKAKADYKEAMEEYKKKKAAEEEGDDDKDKESDEASAADDSSDDSDDDDDHSDSDSD